MRDVQFRIKILQAEAEDLNNFSLDVRRLHKDTSPFHFDYPAF